MTKLTLRLFMLGLSLSAVGLTASAEEALVGDIYYSLDAATKTAKVESKAYGIYEFYSGDIVVPETVNYKGADYTVTGVGQYAFSDYDEDLTSVTLPNTVKSLDSYAFDGTYLTELTLPNSIETIGSSVFEYSMLRKITFGTGLKDMGGNCFLKCNDLREMTVMATVPPTVTANTIPAAIRPNVTLTVPAGCISAYQAAANWSGFKEYKEFTGGGSGDDPDPNTPVQFTYNGIWYEGNPATGTAAVMTVYKLVDSNKLSAYYTGDIVIPSTVSYEGKEYTVTELQDECFWQCTPTTLVLPETLTKLGWESFYDIKSLESLVIPDKVAVIEHGDFWAAYIKEITLGAGVKTIEDNAFTDSNNLTTLTIYATVPPTLAANAFTSSFGNDFIKSKTTLYVPKGTVAAYKAATNWGGFMDYKEIGVVETNHVQIDGIWYRLGTAQYSPEADLGTLICAVDAPVESGFANGDEYTGNIEVPPFITYNDQRYAVTSVAWYAFRDQSGVTSVTLPYTIKSIGNAAFKGTSITSLVLPENVETLDNYVFLGCSQLKELTSLNPVPPHVESSTFNTTLTSNATLYVPARKIDAYKSAQYWKDFTKIEASSLSPIYPEQIILSRTNAARVVGDQLQLTYTILPEDATDKSVEWKSLNPEVATVDGNGLVTVKAEGRANIEVISNGNRTISAMCNILALPKEKEVDGINYRFVYDEEAELSEAYVIRKTTGNYAGEIVIPATVGVGVNFDVVGIDANAFALMDGVTAVTIPASVRSLGFNAFRLCNGLQRVNITSLEAWCRMDIRDRLANPISCSGNLYLNGEPVTAVSISGSAGEVKPYVFQGLATLTDISLGEGIKSIGANAFENCTQLSAVVLPESIESVGMSAFAGCSSLASINIPASLGTVPTGMLQGTAIEEIVVPEGITVIDNQVFRNCSKLHKVTLPASLDMIYMMVFEGCPLDSIVCNGTTPPAFFQASGFGDYAMAFDSSIFPTCLVLVPEEAVNSYKSAAGWKNFANIKANLPEEETVEVTVGDFNYRLYLDRKIAELLYSEDYSGVITVPAEVEYEGNVYNVTSIGEAAFDGLSEVTAINLPESVSVIGKRAFAGTGVDVMSIPQAVTEIPEEMMVDCDNLISLSLPDKFETVGVRAFYGAEKLRYIFCNNLGFGDEHVVPTFATYEGDPTNYGEAFSTEIWPDCMLVIPANMFANYKKANGWKNFKSWAYWHDYDVMPEEFSFTPSEIRVEEGTPVTIAPTFAPADATVLGYIIAGLDTDVATVKTVTVDDTTHFEITYVATGETTLTVYCGLLKAECKIVCEESNGVEGIYGDGEEVRWFDLEGFEIKEPKKGTPAIRVTGTKAEKLLVY